MRVDRNLFSIREKNKINRNIQERSGEEKNRYEVL